ncbi:MAG: hypothetical protein ABIY55_19340, partial [Kofleriaceae bacterium]
MPRSNPATPRRSTRLAAAFALAISATVALGGFALVRLAAFARLAHAEASAAELHRAIGAL